MSRTLDQIDPEIKIMWAKLAKHLEPQLEKFTNTYEVLEVSKDYMVFDELWTIEELRKEINYIASQYKYRIQIKPKVNHFPYVEMKDSILIQMSKFLNAR